MTDIHPMALFRLSVLGPLASRGALDRGEVRRVISELASVPRSIPGSRRVYLSPKTIESWYYAWKHGGIDALIPKPRLDKGQSKLSPALQEAICQAKQENPKRSINTIARLLQMQGIACQGELSRSAIHRLLQNKGISRMSGSQTEPIERRSFVSEHAGDIWYGDVMHGPRLTVNGRLRKVYLVSLMDDATRLITHSAFCLGETALDIEGVLKQALLKRGLPKKLVIDNGAAYRAKSLQAICARLEIRLIYCRPYAPEGKGKLEKWHATFRSQFLSELDTTAIRDLPDLNARLWVWIEQIYHRAIHSALKGQTPLERWQKDLIHIRPLGSFAQRLDELFYHRHKRLVRKDGTVSYGGMFFEVPFELVGKKVNLVVAPHEGKAVWVESADGERLGDATPLDARANLHRKRRKSSDKPCEASTSRTTSVVELAFAASQSKLAIKSNQSTTKKEK